ncbi:MAG: tyrosine-type recombinase/integrase [Thermoproteota archaeon]
MKIYDRQAFEWRKSHRAEIEAQALAFLDRAYRRSRSLKSREAKLTALCVFCGFLRKLPNEIIAGLKSGVSDPYSLLDGFVSYLTKIGVAPHTIKDYVSCVRKWLVSNDVDVDNARLRERVEMPRQYAVTMDAAPTRDELRSIVMATNLRGKTLILTLASSGMRISEALSLRVKDIDFNKHPVTVRIRAEVAKDRQARHCFLSDEAANVLKTYLAERINEPESYVFQGRQQGVRGDGSRFLRGGWRNEPMSYWNADYVFTNALKKAGLYRKDEHGRDVLHIHSLRKFFFTQLLPVLGREIVEALMGHRQFLDSAYRRFTLEQLAEYYSKGMKSLTVMGEPLGEERVKEEFRRQILLVAGFKQEEVSKMSLLSISDEDFQSMVKEKLLGNMVNNGSTQKVVEVNQLEKYLNQGWEFVAALPNNKAIIRIRV